MSREYDLVVVGLGSAGLVAARFAARLRLRVAAIERGRVGGDCLWTGCVPSKALIASARTAHAMRSAARVGLEAVEPEIDLERVWRRMHAVQERIARTDDDPDRLRAIGIDVIEGEARLAGPHQVQVAERMLQTRFTLVCTGSRPAIPPIDGLERAGYLTTETLFELDRPADSLAVVGGGPVAVEIAQACRRLGVAVTLLEQGTSLLPREEPRLVRALVKRLVAEGVAVRTGVDIARVERHGKGKRLTLSAAGEDPVVADEVLVAVGRAPNVEGLALTQLGVTIGKQGIKVDSHLRTSVPSVYAAGDVAGRFLFTHSAGHEAAQAVRNMFFPGHVKAVTLVPACTFTDPELAHVGRTTAEAQARYGPRKVAVHELALECCDRARTDAEEQGALVLITAAGRLVGAHVLAPAAGELIHELALAIRHRLKLHELSGLVHVYPTLSTSIVMLAADAAYARAARYSWLIRRR